MAEVIVFPDRHACTAAEKDRVPGMSRAAISTSLSAESRAERARREARMALHHLSGMLSRCHHLEICATVAPISADMASIEGQREITSRNEEIRAMPESLGQSVLFGNDNPCRALKYALRQSVAVAAQQTKSKFKDEFIARVRWARMARNLSQQEVASLLGIEQGKYQKYEARSLLPHDLVARFCLICGIETDWLFSKKGKGPVTAEPPRQVRKPRTARGKSKAA